MTEIADAFSRRQLEEAGKALSSDRLASYRFEIAGHTDSVGTEEFNRGLSQQRANVIQRFLAEKYAVANDRLVSRGYGEWEPVASNDTEEGRAMNRRVVFRRLD